MSVTIRARLPRTDYDGLQTVAEKYRYKMHREQTVVLVVEVYLDRIVNRLHDANDPTEYVLAVSRIEQLTDAGDESFARSLITTRYEQRTGKAPLPFGTLYDSQSEVSDDEDGTS